MEIPFVADARRVFLKALARFVMRHGTTKNRQRTAYGHSACFFISRIVPRYVRIDSLKKENIKKRDETFGSVRHVPRNTARIIRIRSVLDLFSISRYSTHWPLKSR